MDYLSEIKLHKEKDRVIKYLSYYSNDFYSNVLINNMNFFIKVWHKKKGIIYI